MSKLITTPDQRLTLHRGIIYLDGRRTNFYLTEWVSKRVYTAHGKYALLLLDPETIAVAQFLRDYWGVPHTMNNWYDGGPLYQRGYRSDWTTVGSQSSAHRYSMGGDCSSRKISADRMRRDIMDDQQTFLDIGLRRLEDGHYAPTWLHWDRWQTGLDHIHMIAPSRTPRVQQEIRQLNWADVNL